MTTVVGCARDGAVAMAADTCINVYERPLPNTAHKILRVPTGRGEALLAFAGEGAGPAVVARTWECATEPADDEDPQSWADGIAYGVTKVFQDAGLVREERIDATMLFGWRGRLWTITHMLAIPHVDGNAALGSGEGPAIGALDAFRVLQQPSMDLAEMVTRACAIGIRRDRYSAGPIDTHILLPVVADAAAAI